MSFPNAPTVKHQRLIGDLSPLNLVCLRQRSSANWIDEQAPRRSQRYDHVISHIHSLRGAVHSLLRCRIQQFAIQKEGVKEGFAGG